MTLLRDQQQQTLTAADLVPGDVVLLTSGEHVPADLRLISSKNLQIDEAMLTGESVPTSKHPQAVAEDASLGDQSCLAFAGTIVTYGTASGMVIGTGSQTELGKISDLLHQATDLETPLTQKLAEIGRSITVGILAVTALMLAVGVTRTVLATDVGLFEALRQTVIFAIALAVGAIPEGLPAIVTIALAIGVQRMARRQAIVRKLPAVETLGSTTVICSDKTGTLTRNEMTLRALWTARGISELTGVGYQPLGRLEQNGQQVQPDDDVRELIQAAALCSDATLREEQGSWSLTGDPTEGALVVAAEKLQHPVEALRAAHRRLDVIPFESENQWMATLHEAPDGSRRVLVKGAPEVVLRMCESVDAPAVRKELDQLASRGLRVLAVAARAVAAQQDRIEPSQVQGGLRLLGLLGMVDPPRDEAIRAIEVCRAAGIDVKMITGDHRETAMAIAQQLGILNDAGAGWKRDRQAARCPVERSGQPRECVCSRRP